MKKINLNLSLIYTTILTPIFFVYSLSLLEPYKGGDQYHYRLLYEAFKYANFDEISELSLLYIGASEPLSSSILWVGAISGLEKDIFISLLNTILLIFLFIFLRNNRTSWLGIFLIFTNFYIIVLMTGAERLKIAYIFLFASTIFSGKLSKPLLFLTPLIHFQTLILITSLIASKCDSFFRKLINKLKIEKRDIAKILLATIFLSIILITLSDGLSDKISSYKKSNIAISDTFKLLILLAMVLLTVQNKLRAFLSLISIIPFLLILGGDRVNMIAITISLYLVVIERKQNTLPIYLLLFFMSFKSIDFIGNIYTYGTGFLEQ